MLIHDKFYCEGNSDYAKFCNITQRLNKRQNVEFALYCAKDVNHLVNEQDKEVVKRCIDLVEKWLKDEKSVTKEEVRKAANAAWAAYYAAYAVNAAYAAGWTVANAADAVNAAYAAGWTVANAVDANPNKLNEYFIVANSFLTKTNISCLNYEIEGKILYLIDELEENIVVHKDKYYVNMNGIENCPEYGFDSQEELLDKLLNNEDRFWEFARNWLDQLYKEDKLC